MSRDRQGHLLVVADGMGGHQGGELASQAVIEVAERLWAKRARAPEDGHGFLESLCQQAHELIQRRGQELQIKPRSTIAAVLVTPARAWWVHVGDSRVYAFRDQAQVLRTEDHTVVRNLVRSGKLSEAERHDHPEQHLLLRGLGGADALRTTHGQMGMSPQTGFVLCTDGFWNAVTADELPALLDGQDANDTCSRWAALAAERGGPEGDNVTVAVLLPAGVEHKRALASYWPLIGAIVVALTVILIQAFR